ncbi:hypothetical protein [Chitinilyticum litopenaei]|uniref:hypothetical protein n=1 Tax=Chitinilyticum litopenaei TaxID=1121276 RepID=UPI00130E1A25|nr:hypothetical protein [Chitinilyticum litopenaei]
MSDKILRLIALASEWNGWSWAFAEVHGSGGEILVFSKVDELFWGYTFVLGFVCQYLERGYIHVLPLKQRLGAFDNELLSEKEHQRWAAAIQSF